METCHRFAKLLAFLATDVFRIRAAVLEENLTCVFPEWSPKKRREVGRAMWEHLFLMGFEISHLQRKIHETNWRQHIHLHRKRELVTYLLDPRPIVIVSGHFGNFEMASYTAGLLGISTVTAARPLKNDFLNRYINRIREAKGQFMVPTEGTAQMLQDILKAGGRLALVGDHFAGPKGCWVDFMGRPASCHKALAIFTLSAGAPMVVCYAKRLAAPLQFEVGLKGVADPDDLDESLYGVKPLTQWYNNELEQLVRADPEQYWWIHRRWKGQPRQRRKPRQAAA